MRFYANNQDNFHIRTILKRTFCAFKSRWFLQRINLIPPKNCTCKADVMLTKAVRLQRRTSALQRWKELFLHLRTDNLYYANIIITIIIIISCSSSSFTYNQSDLKLMRCSLCLSSRLDGWQNHRGGVICKQRTSKEDWRTGYTEN